MPLPLLQRVMALLPGVDFAMAYGQTETSGLTALTVADHRRGRREPTLLATVGRALPGISLRIDAPGPDRVGEICAKGPNFGANHPDGWLHTGDLGSLDGEGYLRLAGRVGDMIIRGGENIQPAEVERVLATHPAIRDVCVLGLPDARWGEIVAAVYVRRAAIPLSPTELAAHARNYLAAFKVPAVWREVAELPRNAAGKVLRHVLAKPLAEHARQP
jgi:acyl-CoA synthetase (AMP-forming)/AMP-acid ligase II